MHTTHFLLKEHHFLDAFPFTNSVDGWHPFEDAFLKAVLCLSLLWYDCLYDKKSTVWSWYELQRRMGNQTSLCFLPLYKHPPCLVFASLILIMASSRKHSGLQLKKIRSENLNTVKVIKVLYSSLLRACILKH